MSALNLDHCQACPRLVRHLAQVRQQYPYYYARPVPAFGVEQPRLLIVGLAPGLHGANATGRPFTGDYAGILLYETLYAMGLSNQASSVTRNDGLQLYHCKITNAVKCLPPANQPSTDEVKTCTRLFLTAEITQLATGSVVLALGNIAHSAVLRALNLKLSAYPFGHNRHHRLENYHFLDSYHCSRYNTQTKRLTPAMFNAVLQQAKTLLQNHWE